jgi:branched-chain amino acid transport system substrate-binding protein
VLLTAATPRRGTAATPFEINAILSRTGAGAFIGNTQAQALGALEQAVNKQGGIAGQPIKFVIADDQSNPATTVQLANALIGQHVAVILGSSLAAVCNGIAPLVEKAGPVDYCYSPGTHGAPGGYVFSAGAGNDSIAIVEARYFRERGLTRLAMLSSTDASGQDHHERTAIALRLPENKDVRLVSDEYFGPTDVSVAAQVARIKAARPQALITAATGTAFGTVLRAVADSGLDIPVSSSAGNMILAQMAQYKAFAPGELDFVATHGVAPDPSLARGPVKDAEAAYFAAFQAAGIQPSYVASLAWDPAVLMIDGLRRLGTNASAEQLHRYIEGLHDWAGINGLYDFRDNSQRGIGVNALVVYRWDPREGAFVVASKAGGQVK